MLGARLDEFAARHPEISLNVRVKKLDGEGNILEALSATSAAAPSVLPDLVAMPRPVMEAAALKGLLHPYDGLTNVLDNSDWYSYARQLARLQNSTFGIPFAGDALVMIYHPAAAGAAPHSWEELLHAKGPLTFPAADPQALYTLAMYQAAGGSIQDEQGRPMLDPAPLAQVLSFYQQAGLAGLIPADQSQSDAYEQAWEAFIENRANLVVTWSSEYLQYAGQHPEGNTTENLATPIATPDGVPYTLATGWVWALGSPQPEKQKLAIQLAEFLTDSKFLAEWTSLAGFLPTRSTALTAWPDGQDRVLAGQIVLSAHMIPSADVLSSLAPQLRQVTVQIVKLGGDPQTMAQDTIDRLKNP